MERIKFIARFLMTFLPSAIPRTSMAQFDVFVRDIFEIYDLPDMPSYRQAVASEIMHLKPGVTHKPKRHFAKSIRKAQANEIAYNAITAAREQAKEQAAHEAEGIPKTSA